MLTAEVIRLIERIALVLGALAFAFACGWTVQGWRKDAAIAGLQATQAAARATVAEAAEGQLADAAAKVRAAADTANVNVADLNRKLDQMAVNFKQAKPLPVDCRPDDFRSKHLMDAIDATRSAIVKGAP